MKVTPHEGLFRFWVRSETRDKEYLVDLDYYKGNGCCGCENFCITKEPLLKAGAKPVGDELTCKHIRSARRYLGDELVRAALTIEAAKRKSKTCT